MSQYSAVVDVSALTAQTGFTISHGTAADVFGATLSTGDFDNDGFADIMIGAPGGSNAQGSAFVVFGSDALGATLSTGDLTGPNGFRIDGAGATQKAASAISMADIDNDGFSDLIIGAQQSDIGVSQGGSTYVLYGSAVDPAAVVNLSSINGDNGFRFDGGVVLDRVGFSVSSGDVNGDGIDDVITSGQAGNTGGRTFVVFGDDSGATRTPRSQARSTATTAS